MNYLSFREAMLPYHIFSTKDVIKQFPDFDSRRLVEWQKKGYLQKLINRWYIFKEIQIDEMLLYRISNVIYKPSYISLESALAHYHFIPEGVYRLEAVASRKTKQFETPVATFNYRNLKEKLFFGYHILYKDNLPIMLAEAEKALLDYLYLSHAIKTEDDIRSLRLNTYEIQQNINWEKLKRYALMFNSSVLDKKIKQLQKLTKHVTTAGDRKELS